MQLRMGSTGTAQSLLRSAFQSCSKMALTLTWEGNFLVCLVETQKRAPIHPRAGPRDTWFVLSSRSTE